MLGAEILSRKSARMWLHLNHIHIVRARCNIKFRRSFQTIRAIDQSTMQIYALKAGNKARQLNGMLFK